MNDTHAATLRREGTGENPEDKGDVMFFHHP